MGGSLGVTRRTFIGFGLGAAALGAVGAAAATGVGEEVVGRILPAPGGTPVRAGVRVTSGAFTSLAARAEVGYSIARPARGGPMRVVVVLHGKGGDHRAAFDGLHMDRSLQEAVDEGVPPFALASIDGGDHSYYHRRSDGTDRGAMILQEFLPLLARQGFDTSRVGFQGTSMGGYGALLLAARLGERRTAVVGAEGPAIWRRAADTAAGAYDSAQDFAANDLFALIDELAPVPKRIDIGIADPFYAATTAFIDSFAPRPAHAYLPGGHDPAVWVRAMPDQLRFIGGHLSA
ncbi:alpha/beta hydrolase-fold protein [Tsukamurella sp. 8F]|uniref:alpha/beta hydrolase n=1 Tax=unclassified Tsukamurella TaxID=2633480 RepID=UPI0023B915B7|nr:MULTISPECIES: alpha/beta hydrolase-fold protein [unclassified Tsukamurella]MDF0531319.1 alpha/beta hydrolase-fold protein [Tsukamurella sp. 8J]MDF0588525.1 alpha/beta hydrolase-fold protein [Tsukamurella sp. 8F]